MDDLVERVAIALFCANPDNPCDPFEWKSMITERGRDNWRSMARVAIEATREPAATYDWHCIKYEIPIGRVSDALRRWEKEANLDPGGVTWMDPK